MEYFMKNWEHTPMEVAAWALDNRKWAPEDLFEDGTDHVLLIEFMDKCQEDWIYQGQVVDAKVIMPILNATWKRCFLVGESIKKHRFFSGKERYSHIRVTYKGRFHIFPPSKVRYTTHSTSTQI
jgi:hypothetical protein